MRALFLLCVLGMCALSAGCAADGGNSDPRQGGLFRYSPKAYERRIQEREARVKAGSEEAESAREEQARLHASAEAQERRKAEAGKRLSAMNEELAQTGRMLDAVKARDARAQASLEEMRRRHARLSGNLGSLERSGDSSGAQAERERLDADIQRLKREVEALSVL